MTQVTIRANLPVLGLAAGQETDVEYTPLIKAAAEGGKITLLSEVPDLDEPEAVDATGIEFDATPGETDDPPADEVPQDA